jgi:hypothetical protein
LPLSPRTLTFSAFFLAAAAGALLPAEAAPPSKITPDQPTFSPASDVVLRNTFDDDPTEYIGAFFTGTGIPDESAAAKLKCSSFVSYKEVGGGGETVTDYFRSSVGGALKLGFPPVMADASASSGVTVLVEYLHTKTFRATVADAEGFSQCCANYPGECRPYYVGDFLVGTGKVYIGQEFDAKGKALVVLPAGAIQAKAYGGRDWYSSREFKREVAFAFKLKASPVATSAAFEDPICGTDWQNNVPNDTRGHWEDAVSDMFPDLAGAKDNSWDHAARQVAKWCGASVDTSSGGSRSDKGDGRSGSATILSASEYSVFADAVVKRMRRVCGKEETAESPRGLQYRYRGLYVLPADQVDRVCEEAKAPAGSDGAPPPGATGPKPAPGKP